MHILDIYINGKKINQELCSLICYGELRKKVKGRKVNFGCVYMCVVMMRAIANTSWS